MSAQHTRPDHEPAKTRMSTIEVKVPDIGDFKDVPVIEVLVKPGDAVEAEDALVTLESDKATMDVPSPAAGTVREVRAKVGDKVSEGSLLVMLEIAQASAQAKPATAAAPASPPATAPAARATAGESAPPAAATGGPAQGGSTASSRTSASSPGAASYQGKTVVE
jgi:pyruvate dehydrogenase E2 component (dihydrolipoamide acetyltransferase)